MGKKIRVFLIVMTMTVLGAQIRPPILNGGEVQMESRQEDIEIYVSEDEKTEIKAGTPEAEETEAVKERDVNTGDFSPILGMFFLAVCSLFLGIEEVLRRIKY